MLNRGFPDSSVGKESTCNAGDPSLIPGSGRSPGEGIGYPLQHFWASFVTQLVKNPPAMRETWVRSLGWEDPQGNGKAPHSTLWPGEFDGLYSTWGPKESDTTEQLSLSFKCLTNVICYHLCSKSGEGNGNPLQYSCLENAMDREAWRATVRGVAKTQLSN